MVKKQDSLTDYIRAFDLIMQQVADREEQELVDRLHGLPATDEDIPARRRALRADAQKRGMSPAEAHTWADAFLRRGLDLNIFTANLDFRDDDDALRKLFFTS